MKTTRNLLPIFLNIWGLCFSHFINALKIFLCLLLTSYFFIPLGGYHVFLIFQFIGLEINSNDEMFCILFIILAFVYQIFYLSSDENKERWSLLFGLYILFLIPAVVFFCNNNIYDEFFLIKFDIIFLTFLWFFYKYVDANLYPNSLEYFIPWYNFIGIAIGYTIIFFYVFLLLLISYLIKPLIDILYEYDLKNQEKIKRLNPHLKHVHGCYDCLTGKPGACLSVAKVVLSIFFGSVEHFGGSPHFSEYPHILSLSNFNHNRFDYSSKTMINAIAFQQALMYTNIYFQEGINSVPEDKISFLQGEALTKVNIFLNYLNHRSISGQNSFWDEHALITNQTHLISKKFSLGQHSIYFPKPMDMSGFKPLFSKGGDIIIQDNSFLYVIECKFRFVEFNSYEAALFYLENLVNKYKVNQRPMVVMVDCGTTLIYKQTLIAMVDFEKAHLTPFNWLDVNNISVQEVEALPIKEKYDHLIVSNKNYYRSPISIDGDKSLLQLERDCKRCLVKDIDKESLKNWNNNFRSRFHYDLQKGDFKFKLHYQDEKNYLLENNYRESRDK